MLDIVAAEDEELLEKYLEDDDLEPEEIRKVIRKGTINRDFVPVLCGSAFKNKGVQPLLDAVVWYLPSPLDLPPVAGFKPGNESVILERPPSDDEPFSALAFKIMSDPYVGKLTYFRVYSGHVEQGRRRHQHHRLQEGALRAPAADACVQAGGHRRDLHRRHRCRGWPQAHQDR